MAPHTVCCYNGVHLHIMQLSTLLQHGSELGTATHHSSLELTQLLLTCRSHLTNTACAILTTGAAFKVVSIKNQQSSLTANRVDDTHHTYLKLKAKPP